MQATITTLPGDGIGPEVVAEGVRALRLIAETYGHQFSIQAAAIGGVAIDACGEPLPESTLSACRQSQAVLLGAVGGPKWSDPAASVRPEQGLLGLRKEFDLFANLRPVRTHPVLAGLSPLREDLVRGTNLLFVRELTGGLYFGKRQEGPQAFDTMSYTAEQVERVARVAFQAAQGRSRRLVSVDKANVLATSRLWRRVVDALAPEFPEVSVEHILVDSCAMHLLQKPRHFDVILAENLFGDILSDEASVLAGSLGMLPSASLGLGRFGVYEPVHGSAPDIAGRGIANPVGSLLSCALLLRYSLGLDEEARALERAVDATLELGIHTADLGPGSVSTEAFTDGVLEHLKSESGVYA